MRGMKKWLPFKSLSGQYEVLDKMKQGRKKVDKPELSIDEIDNINHALISLKKGDVANVTFFDDGFILSKDMIFVKYDGYTKTVYFKEMSLPFSSLLKFDY